MARLFGMVKFQVIHVLFFLLYLLRFSERASGNEVNSSNTGIIPKMHGGTKAHPTEAPFTVAVYYKEAYIGTFCILNERSIIGAAHLVKGIWYVDFEENFYGKVGNVDVSNACKIHFRDIRIHENYKEDRLDYDIAILITEQKLKFNAAVQGIYIFGRDVNLERKYVTMYSWGKLRPEDKGFPKDLHKMDFEVATRKLCEDYWDRLEITENNICTYQDTLKFACTGDSGAPLIYQNERGQRFLVGIRASLPVPRGTRQMFGIDMAISRFASWIKKHSVGDVCVENFRPNWKKCNIM